ncbi:MAG: hypothetical protein CMH25_04015 [Micavibrio sp.]|nr:hypothetical protein [Micavibrio sp.]
MKKLYSLIFVFLILAVFLIQQNLSAQEGTQHHPTEILLTSLSEDETPIPYLAIKNKYQENEIQELQECNDNLQWLMKPFGEFNQDMILRPMNEIKFHIGYPKFLFDSSKTKENDMPSIKEYEYFETLNIYEAEKANLANVFLLPVNDKSVINFNTSARFPTRLSINPDLSQPLDHLFSKSFFNLTRFKIKPSEMNGYIVRNSNNKVVASFCPINFNDEESISENLFSCFVQSKGFIGFSNLHENLSDRAIDEAVYLQSISFCDDYPSGKNIILMDVSELVKSCKLGEK